MMDLDDIVDVDAEVESRETILKGKTPRKLFVTVAIICICILMLVGVFVNYNNLNKVPENNENDEKISNNMGQEAKDAVKKDQASDAIGRAEKEQTDEVLARVKGGNASMGVEGNGRKNDPDIADLEGRGDASRGAPSGSKSSDPARDAEDASRQKKESILTAGIFKGGVQSSTATPSAQDPIEAELLRKLNQSPVGASSFLPPDLSGLKPQPPKTAAQMEGDFNAAMESKSFAPPTGIVEKTNNNCILREGWLIPVANMEAMSSDQPGEITLYVRRNVYGSYNNHCLAIPAGATIIATYNPNIVVGQERFNVAATVMQFPNGKRVPMAGTRAYNAQGTAGVEAEVNNHFFKIVGTSLLLGVASRLVGDDQTTTTIANGSATTTSTVLGKTIGETAQSILERNKNIPPTLTKAAGVRFNLKVSREFLLENYRE